MGLFVAAVELRLEHRAHVQDNILITTLSTLDLRQHIAVAAES
jgi:hypothetical protein